MSYSDDAIRLLHAIDRGDLQWNNHKKTMESFGWDKAQSKRVHTEISPLVKTFGGLNAKGTAEVETRPLESDGTPAAPPEGSSLATLDQKRAILGMLKQGKYAKPFEKGRFAAVSLIGTDDWQDYASLVLQMIQVDTMLNIEEKLDMLLTREASDDT